MKKNMCSLASWALFTLLIAPVAMAQRYRITDLGTLPGHDYSEAFGVNAWGQVVGGSRSLADKSTSRAFLWSNYHAMTDLGTLAGGFTVASGINNLGQVVGTSVFVDGSEWNPHAFLWTASSGMQDMEKVGTACEPNACSSIAQGINDFGQVVGFGSFPGFLWTASSGMQDLGFGPAMAINDFGQVVGMNFIWSPTAGLQDLGVLPGNVRSYATAINNFGQVVGGDSSDPGNHAFLWTKSSGMRDLGTLPGGTFSLAYGMNDLGQVVGVSDCNTSSSCSVSSGGHAFLWSDAAGMQDLNNLIPKHSGWVLGLGHSLAINDFGQIAGAGSINGKTHAFLLTPTGSLH